jgi:hypothetical protein
LPLDKPAATMIAAAPTLRMNGLVTSMAILPVFVQTLYRRISPA